MSYRAPVKDMLFCMTELARLGEVVKIPGFKDAFKQFGEGAGRACSIRANSAAKACRRRSVRPASRC
jgi:hypothetical protein